jgi:hypothetical protein
MAYPSPSTINASKGFGEIINYVNTVTDNWFGNMLLIAIWVIVLMGYYKAKDDFVGALAVAGFGLFVVGLLFWIGGMITGIAMSVVIGLAIISIIPLFVDNN